MKPFYVKLRREKYELWKDRSTKRIQGKSSNIYIQISNKKGAKRIKIKRNNEHGSIYEDDFLTEDDIGVIRQYFKENNVERIG